MSIHQQIVVRGEAERRAPADIAALTVVIQVTDPDQQPAFSKAAAVAEAVDAVLDARSEALGSRQATTLLVAPTVRWVEGEQQRTGWQARRATTLDVVRLDDLSSLLAELAAAGAILEGPTWRLRPEHPVLAEVRTAAAADARDRAADYADGLSLTVGRVEWVAEPGLRVSEGPTPAPRAARAMAMAVPAGGEAEVAVAPAELTVAAEVEVAFAIER